MTMIHHSTDTPEQSSSYQASGPSVVSLLSPASFIEHSAIPIERFAFVNNSQSPPGSPAPDLTSAMPRSPQSPPVVNESPAPADDPVRPTEIPFEHSMSGAAQEWTRRKEECGESNSVLDELMTYEGLEEVKWQFLEIKSQVDIAKEQGRTVHDRFNIVFQGNPGTDKTTVTRLFSRFLSSVDLLESEGIKEMSGMSVATKGSAAIKRKLKRFLHNGGGVLFIDEAYQLTAPYMGGVGRQALDIIPTMMENNIGKLVVIFVGYKDEMESFFEHNSGLSSRIPFTITFADFTNAELWKIMSNNIKTQFKSRMRVEGSMEGRYMRIAVRRLAKNRGGRGFGNSRDVQNLLARITNRQGRRLTQAKKRGQTPDCLLLSREDLIGPDPSMVLVESTAWVELQKLVGLERVKESVQTMISLLQRNYQRELHELAPLRLSLNQVFVGAPGTGKTTVAKLYAGILADLGYLSRGDVVLKTPADFIGECVGKSEAKTKKILEATIGKVLVIDEAYLLDAGDQERDHGRFKAGVIDTIVSMVQGVPGEDRAIILVGYEDKIQDMFNHVNPGLRRRFPVDSPFRFENFNISQLVGILQYKMREQDLACTDEALVVVREMFRRALMRPNFTNAGEVDSIMAAAMLRHERRLSQLPIHDQDINAELQAVDFDPDHDRGSKLGTDYRSSIEGQVHHSIVDKMCGYQKQCVVAQIMGTNSKERVPTNFVFKGPPGTGKTATAQQMGKLFYDMSHLATSEVVECSATDLIGQYVGHTAHKTRNKLEQSLGKVLLIDEAYRLVADEFTAQAVQELVYFLFKPAHQGNVVVILAGGTGHMNTLMSTWPALSSLFPEEIVFSNILVDDCITLLARELVNDRIVSEGNFLSDRTSPDYAIVKRLFGAFQTMPSWSNARDIKHLARRMLKALLDSTNLDNLSRMPSQQMHTLSADQITYCMRKGISQQRGRFQVPLLRQPPTRDFSSRTQCEAKASPPASMRTDVDPPIVTDILSTVDTQVGPVRSMFAGSERQQENPFTTSRAQVADPGGLQKVDTRQQHFHAHTNPPREPQSRDPGVSDAAWNELLTAKDAHNALISRLDARRELVGGEAGDATDDMELVEIEKEVQSFKRTQKALQKMGRCPLGFAWYQVAGGWRCEGGSHFASENDIRHLCMA